MLFYLFFFIAIIKTDTCTKRRLLCNLSSFVQWYIIFFLLSIRKNKVIYHEISIYI
ncbi:hypothetical protein HMPREF3191_01141 [Veillonellaceae bacterium DNF00626]|nr:hypothetical protein HMPREF3191_01141 [Veillonellaceae bacterium DNF00626]